MTDPDSPSARIDAKLGSLGDWRGEALTRMRRLIREADPEIVEAVKWIKPSNPSGVPTWEHAGIICTGEIYNAYVKLTFLRGASLADPTGLFNAGFGGGTRRAIDIRQGVTVDAAAFKALVREAVALNIAEQGPQRRYRPQRFSMLLDVQAGGGSVESGQVSWCRWRIAEKQTVAVALSPNRDWVRRVGKMDDRAAPRRQLARPGDEPEAARDTP